MPISTFHWWHMKCYVYSRARPRKCRKWENEIYWAHDWTRNRGTETEREYTIFIIKIWKTLNPDSIFNYCNKMFSMHIRAKLADTAYAEATWIPSNNRLSSCHIFLTHREFGYLPIDWTVAKKHALFEHRQKNQHRK